MDTEIERMDRERLRYLGWYVSCFSVFVVLSLVRFFFRTSGLNHEPIGVAVLVGMVVTAVGVFGCVAMQFRAAWKIRGNEEVKAAFDNEVLRLLDAKAWRAAYIASAVTVLFFAIASSFYSVCDPVMIALTTIVAGAGAQRAAYYFMYRSL